MSNVVHGKNVSMEAMVDGEYIAIGCAVSCSFELENELIGKTDVNAGLNRKKRVRLGDSRGSVQGLTTINSSPNRLTPFHFLQEAIRRSEQDIRFVFQDEAGDTRYIQGLFLVRAMNFTGEISSFSEFDLSLEGTGDITIGTVELPPDLICPILESDTWETEEGETSISGLGRQNKSFAGNEILEVDREGLQYDYKPGSSPGNREFGYNGTEIFFEVPFYEGETVLVVWKQMES